MKQITAGRLFLLAGIIAFISGCSSSKQISTSATPLEITRAINNDQWMFNATYVLPAYGSSRDVIGSYYVKCNSHDLIVALPYFGRLTSPSGNYNGNPLDFHSANFKLSKEERQNGEWRITIEAPNPEVQSMTFSFYDNGTAQLSVVMTSRTAISFNGNLRPLQS